MYMLTCLDGDAGCTSCVGKASVLVTAATSLDSEISSSPKKKLVSNDNCGYTKLSIENTLTFFNLHPLHWRFICGCTAA